MEDLQNTVAMLLLDLGWKMDNGFAELKACILEARSKDGDQRLSQHDCDTIVSSKDQPLTIQALIDHPGECGQTLDAINMVSCANNSEASAVIYPPHSYPVLRRAWSPNIILPTDTVCLMRSQLPTFASIPQGEISVAPSPPVFWSGDGVGPRTGHTELQSCSGPESPDEREETVAFVHMGLPTAKISLMPLCIMVANVNGDDDLSRGRLRLDNSNMEDRHYRGSERNRSGIG